MRLMKLLPNKIQTVQVKLKCPLWTFIFKGKVFGCSGRRLLLWTRVQISTFRRMYLTCAPNLTDSAAQLSGYGGLISISAWENIIFYTKMGTRCDLFISDTTAHKLQCVCFLTIFNIIILRCVIFFGYSFLNLCFLILFTRADTYKQLSVYLYPVWRCLQPCCTMMCF